MGERPAPLPAGPELLWATAARRAAGVLDADRVPRRRRAQPLDRAIPALHEPPDPRDGAVRAAVDWRDLPIRRGVPRARRGERLWPPPLRTGSGGSASPLRTGGRF